jgi:HAD superfamily hydrolase (TIGR01509 family)
MKQHWGLLLDLDQTLILTKPLETMRTKGQWQQIASYFYLTRLPLETENFLLQIQPHFHIGIVTSSPRKYAEGLVGYHHLSVPVLAAYHDTRKHKPEPEPLLFAAEKLGISPTRCLHIGDQAKDIIAAHLAGMIPVGLSWDGLLDANAFLNYPYTLCANWEEVLVYIRKKVGMYGI